MRLVSYCYQMVFVIINFPSIIDGAENLKRTEAGYVKLIDQPECKDDIMKHCPEQKRNFNILTCLHNKDLSNDPLPEACQHLIWQAKLNLTKANSITIDGRGTGSCGQDINNIPDCLKEFKKQGLVVPCLIEYMAEVTDEECKKYLKMVEPLVFSDYRLVYKLVDVCQKDIENFRCGRSNNLKDQGATIDCLSENHDKLNPACRHEIYKIAELQSTDWNNDRPLFIACREDQKKFCGDIAPGSGNVYKCLYSKKMDLDMSESCRNKLRLRQRLQHDDFKVNYQLSDACGGDINKYNCVGDLQNVLGHSYSSLSNIILCIESAKIKGHIVDDRCLSEVKSVRYSLLEDHKINPEVATSCSKEVKLCENRDNNANRYVIHCIMGMARSKYKKKMIEGYEGVKRGGRGGGVGNQNDDNNGERGIEVGEVGNDPSEKATVSARCLIAVEMLLKEVNIRDNYDIDPALIQDCAMSIARNCYVIKPGSGKIISCLMFHLNIPLALDQSCKDRLMEIQYFISKDFQISNRFMDACNNDIKSSCSNGMQDLNLVNQSELLSCLYRNKYDKLSTECYTELNQLMMDRARSVDLPPKIQAICIKDLVRFCHEASKRDEEMDCLETNYDKLDVACQKEVAKVVKEEEEMPMISRLFIDACEPMWRSVCKSEVEETKKKKDHGKDTNILDGEKPTKIKEDDEDYEDGSDVSDEDILKCLIRHKYDEEMPPKCKAGVEHHQIISLKSVEFSLKFNKSCAREIKDHCAKFKEKILIVKCLSEVNLNDTLLNNTNRVNRKCLKQLQFEQLQIRESIKLDPLLAKDCNSDIKKFCSKVKPGQGAVLECLKKHQNELVLECTKVVFRRELNEAISPLIDYTLLTKCKHMIHEFCSNYKTSPKHLLNCLKNSRDENGFDMYCKDVVNDRLRTRALDIRLNPTLKSSCMEDIVKHCELELDKVLQSDTPADGLVMTCLKSAFIHERNGKTMSHQCKNLIHEAIKDAAVDYIQDASLVAHCRSLITDHCSREALRNSLGQNPTGVVDCLEETLLKNKEIREANSLCLTEILRKLNENKLDYQVDQLLYRACAEDARIVCKTLSQGEGRIMSCLVDAYNNKEIKLSHGCTKALKDRTDLWNLAMKVAPPESVGEMLDQIHSSSSKNYFIAIIFLISSVVFFSGLLCGRVIRRISKTAKNK